MAPLDDLSIAVSIPEKAFFSVDEIMSEISRRTRSDAPQRTSILSRPSKLCSICESVFNNIGRVSATPNTVANSEQIYAPTDSERRIPHHSLDKLAIQAIQGCRLCLQVYLGLDPEALTKFARKLKKSTKCSAHGDRPHADDSTDSSSSTSVGFACMVPLSKDQARLSFCYVRSTPAENETSDTSKDVHSQQSGLDADIRQTNLRVSFILQSASRTNDVALRTISDHSITTASIESFQIAKQWIQNCTKHHARCSGVNEKLYRPTYVLDISVRDTNETSGVRLVDGDSLSPDSEYVTLSHSWGPGKAIRLHTRTLPALRQGVARSNLPKSLADAALVAQKLGYRYLWIDALCIMHDDEQAVLGEMARMRDIYQGAVLNIAATCAWGDSEGFIRSRNVTSLQPYTAEVRGHAIHDGTYTVLRSSTWDDMVDRSPLSKRAWIFQERALARRTLHFTRNELMWECGKTCCSETYSEGSTKSAKECLSQLLMGHGTKSRPPTTAKIAKQLYHEQLPNWARLVEAFSAGRLSFWSDKLMAISGLAREYMSRNQMVECDYIAGLWRFELPYSLLWQVRNGRRPPRYRAPTWSWASVDGRIAYTPYNHPSVQPCLKALSTHIQNSHKDTFGFCERAELEVSGFLARGVLQPNHAHPDSSICSLQFSGAVVDFQAVSFDEEQPRPSPDSEALEVYVLPVAYMADRVQGLFLSATGEAGQFQRIASFELPLEDGSSYAIIKSALEADMGISYFDDSLRSADLMWFAESRKCTITLI